MNAPLRRVGVVVLILFGLLFANLNWVQAYKADAYRNSQYNGRVLITDYERQRGTIYDASGAPLAVSVPTNDQLKYLRTYPGGQAFEPILGYRPVNLGATGIENAMNPELAGTAQSEQSLTDLFFDRTTAGDNVYLTLEKSVQTVAYNDLIGNGAQGNGAVVAIDPTTGKILAMVSTPGFDPTDLASHDGDTAQAAYNKISNAPNQPFFNKAISDAYPPGSTFKTIISAAALNAGYNPQVVIPAGDTYQPVPGSTYVMHNAEDDTCPTAQMTLIQALTVSCNTAFGQLGVKLGAQAITNEARAFGFGDDTLTVAGTGDRAIPVAASQVGDMTNGSGLDDPNLVAQSSIGQYDDRMTPLMGCMIAATVANNGVQMKPYLVDKLQAPNLSITQVGVPSVLRTPISPQVAGELQTMMYSVVANGTATGAQIKNFQVGGKTGTAQNGNDANGNPLPEHRWFIGFAMDANGKPIAAVCVFLKNGGLHPKKQASTIGGDVLRAAIAAQGGH